MGIINRLKFIWHNCKKLQKLEIEFDLVTQSGNVIHTLNKEIQPTHMMIEYSYSEWYKYQKIIDKKYKEILDKMANEILNDYQKKERKNISNGFLDSGDYIVKCIWDISPRFEWISYKEYKEFKEDENRI